MQVQPQFLGSFSSPSSIPRSMSSHPHLSNTVSDSHWHQPSDSTSATASQIYSMLNQAPSLVDYAPARTSSDSSFGNYNAGHMSPSIAAGQAGEYFDYTPQMDGSTGPSRGNISRRKARVHSSQHLPIGRSNRENQVRFFSRLHRSFIYRPSISEP